MREKGERRSIVTQGVLNIDFVLEASDRMVGEKIVGNKFSLHAGGHGTTLSVAAARDGAEVTVLGKVGGDLFGSQIAESLSAEGVDCSLLRTAAQSNTGLGAIVVQDGKDNMYVDFLGANYGLTAEDMESCSERIGASSLVVTHMDRSCLAASRRLVQLANERGVPTIVYPSPLTLSDLEGLDIDYLILTFSNVQDLCGFPVSNVKSARLATNALSKCARKAVLFQMDTFGVLIATPEKWLILDPRPESRVVDRSGMTDFFVGILAAELVQERSLEEGAIIAHRAGILCGEKVGVFEAYPSRETLAGLH